MVSFGMPRPTVKRSDLAGWAGYGYCASHSRFYWGLKLYLVCTPSGMPILWALADPKIGEREVLASMLEVEADMVAEHDGILLVSDKGFAGRAFETLLEEHGITLLRPSRKDEKARYGEPMLKKVRQLIESVNDTSKVSSTSNTTAAAAVPESRFASLSTSSRWPPRCGTTTQPKPRSPGH
ncbi:transposase [Streptomyces sp. NPDC021080]|uniref:transposase n=1 Tax=Streptomyces sp. NPDC021080 TaxID=3365110 RepID=UPI0037B8B986